MLIWTPGKVARVADGVTDKKSARALRPLHAGAVLFQWEADAQFGERAGEQWLILLPKKWNTHVLYGWRYDPSQLALDATGTVPAANARRPQCARRAVAMCDYDDE